LTDFRRERDELEELIWKEAEFYSKEPPEAQCRFTKEILERTSEFEKGWLQKLRFTPKRKRFLYGAFWEKLSRRNGIPSFPVASIPHEKTTSQI
jgi:hypothetical protein